MAGTGIDPEVLRAERERLGAAVDALSSVYVIFGDPIAHVRAPVVWSALFRRHGVNAVFLPAHVAPEGLDAAIEGMKAWSNLGGLMFTMPHKAAALRHCDELSARAQRVGSINLMRRAPDGRWLGDNVDGAGFIAGLKADGVALAGACVHVHGAGGVGQNIAWSLSDESLARLTIFDVDTQRAADLAARIRAQTGCDAAAGLPSDWGVCTLAINATPLGLSPADPMPFAVDALPSHAWVADVIMEPMHTALLRAAQARGLHTHHGRNLMNFAMPLAAHFYGLPGTVDWNGAPLQSPR